MTVCVQCRMVYFILGGTLLELDGPAAVPLPIATFDQKDYMSNEGTQYMEDSID